MVEDEVSSLLAAPVVVLIQRWSGRSVAATDTERAASDREAALPSFSP